MTKKFKTISSYPTKMDNKIARLEYANKDGKGRAVDVAGLQRSSVNALLSQLGPPNLIEPDEDPCAGVARLYSGAADTVGKTRLGEILQWFKRHSAPTGSNADTLRKLAKDSKSVTRPRFAAVPGSARISTNEAGGVTKQFSGVSRQDRSQKIHSYS